MPLYEYQCNNCGKVIEEFDLLTSNLPTSLTCPYCSDKALRIISPVAIKDDYPTWLDQSVRDALQDESEQPIKSRTDYERVLKEKNIVER